MALSTKANHDPKAPAPVLKESAKLPCDAEALLDRYSDLPSEKMSNWYDIFSLFGTVRDIFVSDLLRDRVDVRTLLALRDHALPSSSGHNPPAADPDAASHPGGQFWDRGGYFEYQPAPVRMQMPSGGRIILCIAEPDWVKPRPNVQNLRDGLFYFERRLVDALGPAEGRADVRVILRLAGDLHHYRRHQSATSASS